MEAKLRTLFVVVVVVADVVVDAVADEEDAEAATTTNDERGTKAQAGRGWCRNKLTVRLAWTQPIVVANRRCCCCCCDDVRKYGPAMSFMTLNLLLLEDKLAQLFNIDRAFEECLCLCS